MRTIIGLLLSLTILIACSKENQTNKDKSTNSYSFFEKNLKADMDYQTITAKFGIPSRDIGSGIHIYVYELNDSTEVWIGFIDKILYARHMDVNHEFLGDLIK